MATEQSYKSPWLRPYFDSFVHCPPFWPCAIPFFANIYKGTNHPTLYIVSLHQLCFPQGSVGSSSPPPWLRTFCWGSAVYTIPLGIVGCAALVCVHFSSGGRGVPLHPRPIRQPMGRVLERIRSNFIAESHVHGLSSARCFTLTSMQQ